MIAMDNTPQGNCQLSIVNCQLLKTMISYQTDGTQMPDIKKRETTEWIKAVAASYGKRVGDVAYIFCSDEKILEVNRQYLQHDYYTDIITFDYCEGNRLDGDLFISLDSVRSNAEELGTDYDTELHRVIIHGILHLCGINDKGPGEREIMEEAENRALREWRMENRGHFSSADDADSFLGF